MRLKSFNAKTMTEAMKMIRESLGEDAIIVATREEKGRQGVRVTAAIDPAFEVGQGQVGWGQNVSSDESWLQYDEENEDHNSVMEMITEVMFHHGVPEDITDEILSVATIQGLEDPHIALLAALEDVFSFRSLFDLSSKNRFLFMGPSGAGKTLTVAKYAAQCVMDGHSVAVLTADTQRAGGVEQLEAFTRILDIPLIQVGSPQILANTLAEHEDVDYIFVDMMGANPFDPRAVNALDDYSVAGACEPVLVLPAATDVYESEDLAKIYASLGVRAIIPTRLDMARRYGGLLSAAYAGKLSFIEAGTSHNVAGGLDLMTPQKLAHYLMPQTMSHITKERR